MRPTLPTRPRTAHGPGRRAGALRLLALYDLRLLSGGVSAVRRRSLHWTTGDRAGAFIQHASVGRDESQRPTRGNHGRGRNHELRQRAELREGVSDEYPPDPRDLRGKP